MPLGYRHVNRGTLSAMGIVSVGRSLVIRQWLLSGLVLALGAYGWTVLSGVEGEASLVQGEAGARLAGALQTGQWSLALAAAFAAAVMAGVSVPIIGASVGRPLAALAAAAEQVVAGDAAGGIKGEERSDEIGRIARALAALRAAAAQRAAPVPAEPALSDVHVREMRERIERFAIDLTTNLRRVETMTRRLADAAETMTISARHANDGSDKATNASADAAGDVSSVATASEQLLDSIEEISRQVVQSTSVVRTAVERAVETNAGMGRLSSAAQKVGDVVSLISRIAAQTNLLALNATIEAARAGEAGRGFAVVAQEVKTLATQTAKATQDISGQIAEMQQATDLSVDAIDKIQKKISEVEHISTIIASAVHEQGAATQEIARNVRSAAAGTASMSGHIENVVRSIGDTASSAASVSTLARELDEIAAGMTAAVGSFAAAMRAA